MLQCSTATPARPEQHVCCRAEPHTPTHFLHFPPSSLIPRLSPSFCIQPPVHGPSVPPPVQRLPAEVPKQRDPVLEGRAVQGEICNTPLRGRQRFGTPAVGRGQSRCDRGME